MFVKFLSSDLIFSCGKLPFLSGLSATLITGRDSFSGCGRNHHGIVKKLRCLSTAYCELVG